MQSLFRYFIKYGLVGVINTIVGYAIIFSLMDYTVWSPQACNAAGYGVCFFLSFVLNKRLTFKSQRSMWRELIPFFITSAIAYLANLLALTLFLHVGVHKVPAQLLAGVVYVIIGFLLARFVVFDLGIEQGTHSHQEGH